MTEGCSELEPYVLRVLGDSMAPEFWDGCIIVVEPAHSAPDQAYVTAEVGGEVILRQLITDGDRQLLRPLNDAYPVIELGAQSAVRGVVVQRAGTKRAHHKHYLQARGTPTVDDAPQG